MNDKEENEQVNRTVADGAVMEREKKFEVEKQQGGEEEAMAKKVVHRRLQKEVAEPTIKSTRLIGQNVHVAQKAEELTKKRNLEGTSTTSSSNSFFVLNDADILTRSANMGVNVNINDMEPINVLRDLELTRQCLIDKNIG